MPGVLEVVVVAVAEEVEPGQPAAAAVAEPGPVLASCRQGSNPEWRTEHRPAERVA